MEVIRNRFAVVCAIWTVSPRNPVWKAVNHSKPVEGGIERLFPRVKQMNGIYNDNIKTTVHH